MLCLMNQLFRSLSSQRPHFDFSSDMDCTPLPVGTNHVAGYDTLSTAHAGLPVATRATTPSTSTPSAEGVEHSPIGAHRTSTSSVRPPLAASDGCSPPSASGTSTSLPCSPTVVRSPLAVGAGSSPPGGSGASTPSTRSPLVAGAHPVGATAPSPVATSGAPSGATAHRTSASSTYGFASSLTSASLQQVVPMMKVVAIP
jgi:hypothetical protein